MPSLRTAQDTDTAERYALALLCRRVVPRALPRWREAYALQKCPAAISPRKTRPLRHPDGAENPASWSSPPECAQRPPRAIRKTAPRARGRSLHTVEPWQFIRCGADRLFKVGCVSLASALTARGACWGWDGSPDSPELCHAPRRRHRRSRALAAKLGNLCGRGTRATRCSERIGSRVAGGVRRMGHSASEVLQEGSRLPRLCGHR